MQRHLAVFVKAPEMGRVKRRLAAGIGAVAATQFYRVLSRRLVRRLAHGGRWRTSLWVTPDRACRQPALWPTRATRFGQGPGDLGARMQRPFRALPPGPVVLVGSDVPALGARQVASAFRLLGRNDAVFGPATDGGYWLVGLSARARRHRPFRNVRWSGPFALADTLANLRGLRVAHLAPLSDIDTVEDYRAMGKA